MWTGRPAGDGYLTRPEAGCNSFDYPLHISRKKPTIHAEAVVPQSSGSGGTLFFLNRQRHAGIKEGRTIPNEEVSGWMQDLLMHI